MQKLAAMKLPEHIEDARDLSPDGALAPALFLPMEICDEIAMLCVLEHEVVDDARVGTDVGKDVEHANCPRMVVEQQTEVRLAQPSVDPRTDFQTNRRGNDSRVSKRGRKIDLTETSFADQAFDAISETSFGALYDLAGVEKTIPASTCDVERPCRAGGCGRRISRHGGSASMQAPDSIGQYVNDERIETEMGPIRTIVLVDWTCQTANPPSRTNLKGPA
jgi:hypothetical protein